VQFVSALAPLAVVVGGAKAEEKKEKARTSFLALL